MCLTCARLGAFAVECFPAAVSHIDTGWRDLARAEIEHREPAVQARVRPPNARRGLRIAGRTEFDRGSAPRLPSRSRLVRS